ncbi:SMC family ATPase [Candidatus Woesearchaeota archaeon]|nr:SMC family ATPase [Candidatus Woesearchaeota archaeon]
MLLKSIKLNNIRSYLNEQIDFPEGSVMLSGDIGSGKSTILLASEFALFGIMKGDVSGESLLRHGKKEGSVEVVLEINRQEVVINRALKRSKQGVKQEAGYIIVNGVKKAATATELKAVILDLLGYPRDLLTKSKGLIYRYTVYTPQEEMKKILFEDEEARLNTLRKVFDVDKYKRIRENAKLYIYELKGKIREIEGSTSDLEEKRSLLNEKKSESEGIRLSLSSILPNLKLAKGEVDNARKSVKECEKDTEKLVSLKKEFALCDAELKNRLSQRQRNSIDIDRISKQAEQLKKDVSGKEDISVSISAKIKEKENALNYMQDTILKISKKIAEMSSKKEISKEIKGKVSKLSSCPTCLQEVSHEHKKRIVDEENRKIQDMEETISIHAEQEKKANEEIRKLKKEFDELRKIESAAEAVKVKLNELSLRLRNIEILKKEQEKIKQDIGKINMKKMKLGEEIDSLKGIEEKYRNARKSLDEKQNSLHEIEIEKNTFETDLKGRLALIKQIEAEIGKKEGDRKKLGRIRDIQHWLDNNFTSLMALMEKQVMAKVYHSFNELFQNWFKMLMEDETINARLDDSFTPVIQQNGYDTNIAFLSGGEKTSCALAYRLALNKVINDLISTVNTKDLIILDEPTDGFSSEQLDRVREVVDELGMRQIIIVSHEQKVEGFVDKVIRIQKNEHVSSVV